MIKCYDVVSMVTDEATAQFGSLWKVNENRQNELKHNCELIDSLSQECGGISYEVDIDDITMEISVAMECDELVVNDKDSVFYKLLERVKGLKFGSTDENLCIKFVFGSIWDRTV